ncbi:hypothetical protein F2P81_014161 [Scophthalmus maximus]|uniref:Dynein light chain n=1 Tax=Scophthalmus maximus TaxID=52904 RepID=A0A6A4SNG7_SCOMX|nr:hypothetical protein F2P81_014161 [Scophthalmus maximus]
MPCVSVESTQATMPERESVIEKTDMSEKMQHDAVELASQALEKHYSELDMASYIRGRNKPHYQIFISNDGIPVFASSDVDETYFCI